MVLQRQPSLEILQVPPPKILLLFLPSYTFFTIVVKT